MANIIQIAKISDEEIINKLFQFYQGVEDLLEERLSLNVWTSPEQQKGAKASLDIVLRKLVRTSLSPIIPGSEIRWDEQLQLEPVYSDSNIVLVDLVDGARQYARQGAAITSHLGIFHNDNGSFGPMQLGLVSYPFHRYRVLAIGEGAKARVYWMPFSFDFLAGDFSDKLEQHRLPPNEQKGAKGFYLVDRYLCYNADDPIRRRLDEIRKDLHHFGGEYTVCRGSIAKHIVDVTIGAADIVIYRCEESRPPLPYYDYLTPSKILQASGGCFTTLDGAMPDGKKPINGFIAARDKYAFDFAKKIAGLS